MKNDFSRCKRNSKLMVRYWSAVQIQLSLQTEDLAELMNNLAFAIFEYKEFSRAECILDGLYQKYGCSELSPY